MAERQFAADCPDDCPPSDAVDADGDYFRLTHNDPPIDADFKTFAETGSRPGGDACLRCGLSVFDSERGAVDLYRYMQRRHPDGTSLGHFVVRLELRPGDGKVKQTRRPPHHTWWMYRDTDRQATFRETVKDLSDVVAD